MSIGGQVGEQEAYRQGSKNWKGIRMGEKVEKHWFIKWHLEGKEQTNEPGELHFEGN